MNTPSEFKLLTLGFVKELCADIGISVNRTSGGDLRVARRNDTNPDHGYYASDLDDVLNTARSIHHEN